MKKLILNIFFIMFVNNLFAQHWITIYNQNFGNSPDATPQTSSTPSAILSPATTDYTAWTGYSTGPSDGSYSISNASGNGAYASSWLQQGDHTGGNTAIGTGNVMVVNLNPAKKGAGNGTILEINQNTGVVPGADYRFSFYGANLLSQSLQPISSVIGGLTYQTGNKDGFVALGVFSGTGGTGINLLTQQYQLKHANPVTNTSLPWTQFTANYSVPLTYTSSKIYFNYYNWDPDPTGSASGNDIAIDDILIEEYVVYLSGTVYVDSNFNNTGTLPYNGLGVLRVVFVDKNNTVQGVAPVQANGTYSFTNIALTAAGDIGMKLILTSDNPAIGSSYNYTSANFPGSIYATQSDISNNPSAYQQAGYKNVIGLSNTSVDLSNVDFGITYADHGDAPDSYKTTVASNGASSSYRLNYLRLGVLYGYQNNGIPSVGSNTDTNEDGVSVFPNINIYSTSYSISVSVYNNSGATKTLQGWLDFNRNGIFDTNEYATVSVTSTGAIQNVVLTWTGLSGLVSGNSYFRLRFDDGAIANTSSFGKQGSGEVEDYKLFIYGDSDSDGISDDLDLDDDNDGILDLTEQCYGFRAQELSGTWIGNTNTNVTVDYAGALSQAVAQKLSDSFYNYWINQNGAGKRLAKASNINYTFTFANPVPSTEIAFYMMDIDATSGSSTASYTFRINGGIVPLNVFTVASAKYANAYNATTGIYTSPGSGLANDDQYLLIRGTSDTLISSITVTSTSVGSGDVVAYSLLGYKICDTDSDGKANELDIDSDGDGCADAIEGSENVKFNQVYPLLLPVSDPNYPYRGQIKVTYDGVTTGLQTDIISNSASANGVPQLLNNIGNNLNATSNPSNMAGVADATDSTADIGQGVGTSSNNLLQDIECSRCFRPATSGIGSPTIHGITALGRAGVDNGNWPMKIMGAYTVLDAKTKGFVINRLTTVQINALIPVKGMLVYDTTAMCLKIYDGTIWSCYNTQTCDDFTK